MGVSWPSHWGRATAPHAVAVLFAPPVLEPFTLAEAKLRAGLEWADGDPRDALMTSFMATAVAKVQKDTGVALLPQTWDVFADRLSGQSVPLPWRPVQSVTWVKSIDSAGVTNTLAAGQYVLDPSSVAPTPARLGLADTGVWPTDLRGFQPWMVRIVVGCLSLADLTAKAPELVQAVGLLIAHYATVGRDLTTGDASITTTPLGYADLIAPYELVTLA
jgi:uncharacterized phiE125 gp8 family phage protein